MTPDSCISVTRSAPFSYPTKIPKYLTPKVMAAIRAIRNIRAEAEAAPSKKLHAVIIAEGSDAALAEAGASYIKALGGLISLTVSSDRSIVPADARSAAVPGMEIYVPVDELVDYAKEKEKLTKEAAKLEAEIARAKNKLANQGFVSKAPQHLIDEEKAKGEKYCGMLETVTTRLEALRK